MDISTRSSITKIVVFLLVEQTQAKNRPNGNFVAQTFQKQSLSRPKTSMASLLETPVWHSEPIQFRSDLKPALSLSRDKPNTTPTARELPSWPDTLIGSEKKRIFALAFYQKRLNYHTALSQQDDPKLDEHNRYTFDNNFKIIAMKVWIKQSQSHLKCHCYENFILLQR